MKVLVVFVEIPDNMYFLKFDTDNIEMFKRFNNHYINSEDCPNDVCADLDNFFYDEDGHFKFKEDALTTPIESEHFDLIIHCGFIL